MGREASPETRMRNMTTLLRERADEIALLRSELHGYKWRATKAEQEAAAWRERFDLLLKSVPSLVNGPASRL